jgi:hypothetical protein
VLGVSSSLYNDAYLDEIINTAEGVILPLLTEHEAAIQGVELVDNIAYFYTVRPHGFVEGQTVVINNVGAPFDGSRAVTDDIATFYTVNRMGFNIIYSQVFTQSITNADIERRPIIPTGRATLSGKDAATLYANNPNVESAVLVVSVEVFQSRTAPGGQIEGVDFTATPYRMGRSLYSRVQGLLGNMVDVETLAQ